MPCHAKSNWSFLVIWKCYLYWLWVLHLFLHMLRRRKVEAIEVIFKKTKSVEKMKWLNIQQVYKIHLFSICRTGNSFQGQIPLRSFFILLSLLYFCNWHDFFSCVFPKEEFGGDKSSDSSDDEDWSDQFGGDKSSDSSDDEEWSDTVAPRKRKRGADKAASASKNGDFISGDNIKHNKNGTELTPRRTSNRMDSPGTSSITAKLHKSSSTPGSTGGRARSSTNRRLGEAITQVIKHCSFISKIPRQDITISLSFSLSLTRTHGFSEVGCKMIETTNIPSG